MGGQALSAAAVVVAEDRQRIAGALRSVRTGQASVQRGVLHSPHAMIEKYKKRKQKAIQEASLAVRRAEAHKKRRLELDAAAAAAALALEDKTCRVCRSNVHRGGAA